MRYEGKIFRPPSEAYSYILQATIGCSWNHCTYCDMYRQKEFRERSIEEILEDIDMAQAEYGQYRIEKVFVGDGDALVMDLDLWIPILKKLKATFPKLRQVSCYATAENLIKKTQDELNELQNLGLNMLYIGPESGDDKTLKRIAKGSTFAEHVEAADKAHKAKMKLSVIFLLGAGGIERSKEHAKASAKLLTAMNPEYSAALTLSIIEGTPMHKLQQRGDFTLPSKEKCLEELYTLVEGANPVNSVFRSNHASNYLPIAGNLPENKDKLLEAIKMAQEGLIPLRKEWQRGL